MIGGHPRILIIRLSAIGDVVRTLPALHILRDAYPDAQIDWVVESRAAEVLTGHPALDTMLVVERSDRLTESSKAFWRICCKVRAGRYDMAFDFHGIFKSGLFAAASRAPKRYGFARPRSQECSSLFSNRRVKLSSERLNRVEENVILCEAAVNHRRGWPRVMLYVPPEVQDDVDSFYDQVFDGGKRVVALHAPVDRPEKQWPLGHFAKLADMLLADGRFEVLLTWGPGQFRVVEHVVDLTRRKPVIAPETPDLKHYAWLVHRADVYCGGDTGPMHIAAVMDTPVVAVFGGTDPAKHAPYHHKHIVLYAGAQEKGRLTPAERLERITPEMAYDACVRLCP